MSVCVCEREGERERKRERERTKTRETKNCENENFLAISSKTIRNLIRKMESKTYYGASTTKPFTAVVYTKG